jgi:hypothetical protein
MVAFWTLLRMGGDVWERKEKGWGRWEAAIGFAAVDYGRNGLERGLNYT